MGDERPDPIKVDALKGWLQEQFPGWIVDNIYDHSRESEFYRIAEGAELRHRVYVSVEFLEDLPVKAMLMRCKQWNVGGLVRGAGLRTVVITTDGVKVPGGTP